MVNCPKCGRENKDTNINCIYCSENLIDVDSYNTSTLLYDTFVSKEGKEVSPKVVGCLLNMVLIFFFGIWLFFGVICLGAGIFLTVYEHGVAKDYDVITATLKEYSSCSDDDLCKATYEFDVDGVSYTVETSLQTNTKRFSKEESVYYNPKNPSEALIYGNWTLFIVIGTIICVVVVAIFILANIGIRKLLNRKKDSEESEIEV